MRPSIVFIILSLLLLTNSNISSQIRISGVVADENGDRLESASVQELKTFFNQVSLSLGLLFRNEQYIEAIRQWGSIIGAEKYFHGINQRCDANVLLLGINVEYGVSFYQGFPISKWSWKSCTVGLEYNKYKEYNELNIALKYIVKYN